MPIIKVTDLARYFSVYKRQGGFLSAIGSIFRRKNETVKAVDGLSFEIEQGELVGFIGRNGAGKTTTLKCLSGLLYPTSGAISVLGFTPYRRQTSYLKQISLVMGQKNQLWWDLPPLETFKLNKEIYEINDKEFKENLEELTKLLDVADYINLPVRKLSLGQRMKMELIAALLHKPKVLFLDEPTIGLDVVMQKKMRDFISEYNRKYNATILLTSHYMSDVKSLCKRVIVIDRGKIMYDGNLDTLGKKFAGYKIISIDFASKVEISELKELGQIISYNHPKLVLKVDRIAAAKVAAKILRSYTVEDLTIVDPEIEDIIRQVFGEHKKGYTAKQK